MRVFLGVLFDGQAGSFKILQTLLLPNLGVLRLIIFEGTFLVIFWLSGYFSIFGIFSIISSETIILDGLYEEIILSRGLEDLFKVLYLLISSSKLLLILFLWISEVRSIYS